MKETKKYLGSSKVHYKMYKAKKRWLFASATIVSLSIGLLSMNKAEAAQVDSESQNDGNEDTNQLTDNTTTTNKNVQTQSNLNIQEQTDNKAQVATNNSQNQNLQQTGQASTVATTDTTVASQAPADSGNQNNNDDTSKSTTSNQAETATTKQQSLNLENTEPQNTVQVNNGTSANTITSTETSDIKTQTNSDQSDEVSGTDSSHQTVANSQTNSVGANEDSASKMQTSKLQKENEKNSNDKSSATASNENIATTSKTTSSINKNIDDEASANIKNETTGDKQAADDNSKTSSRKDLSKLANDKATKDSKDLSALSQLLLQSDSTYIMHQSDDLSGINATDIKKVQIIDQNTGKVLETIDLSDGYANGVLPDIVIDGKVYTPYVKSADPRNPNKLMGEYLGRVNAPEFSADNIGNSSDFTDAGDGKGQYGSSRLNEFKSTNDNLFVQSDPKKGFNQTPSGQIGSLIVKKVTNSNNSISKDTVGVEYAAVNTVDISGQMNNSSNITKDDAGWHFSITIPTGTQSHAITSNGDLITGDLAFDSSSATRYASLVIAPEDNPIGEVASGYYDSITQDSTGTHIKFTMDSITDPTKLAQRLQQIADISQTNDYYAQWMSQLRGGYVDANGNILDFRTILTTMTTDATIDTSLASGQTGNTGDENSTQYSVDSEHKTITIGGNSGALSNIIDSGFDSGQSGFKLIDASTGRAISSSQLTAKVTSDGEIQISFVNPSNIKGNYQLVFEGPTETHDAYSSSRATILHLNLQGKINSTITDNTQKDSDGNPVTTVTSSEGNIGSNEATDGTDVVVKNVIGSDTGKKFTATVDGKSASVGNVVNFKWGTTNVNYVINDNKADASYTLSSGSRTYDGTSGLVDQGLTATITTGAKPGQEAVNLGAGDYKITGYTPNRGTAGTETDFTDAGQYTYELTEQGLTKVKGQLDANHQLSDTSVQGNYTVAPKAIDVSYTHNYTYNGQAQGPRLSDLNVSGLVSGDTLQSLGFQDPMKITSGSETLASALAVPNDINNYDFTVTGEISINSADTSYTLSSGSRTYDGTSGLGGQGLTATITTGAKPGQEAVNLGAGDYKITGYTPNRGTAGTETDFTDAGQYTYELTEQGLNKVKGQLDTDHQLSDTSVQGNYTVAPKAIDVSYTHNYTYNGQAQGPRLSDLNVSGLVSGDTLQSLGFQDPTKITSGSETLASALAVPNDINNYDFTVTGEINIVQPQQQTGQYTGTIDTGSDKYENGDVILSQYHRSEGHYNTWQANGGFNSDDYSTIDYSGDITNQEVAQTLQDLFNNGKNTLYKAGESTHEYLQNESDTKVGGIKSIEINDSGQLVIHYDTNAVDQLKNGTNLTLRLSDDQSINVNLKFDSRISQFLKVDNDQTEIHNSLVPLGEPYTVVDHQSFENTLDDANKAKIQNHKFIQITDGTGQKIEENGSITPTWGISDTDKLIYEYQKITNGGGGNNPDNPNQPNPDNPNIPVNPDNPQPGNQPQPDQPIEPEPETKPNAENPSTPEEPQPNPENPATPQSPQPENPTGTPNQNIAAPQGSQTAGQVQLSNTPGQATTGTPGLNQVAEKVVGNNPTNTTPKVQPQVGKQLPQTGDNKQQGTALSMIGGTLAALSILFGKGKLKKKDED